MDTPVERSLSVLDTEKVNPATNYKLQQRALSIVRRVTGLDEDAAQTLLEASGGEVKAAILVARANISPEQARERLAAHGYVLRAALDSTQ